MPSSQTAVYARDHTILGICEALGEDFGFKPIFLRVPLAVLLLWNPAVVIGAYAGLGALVLLSRLLIPNPPAREAIETTAEPAPPQGGTGAHSDLPLAA